MSQFGGQLILGMTKVMKHFQIPLRLPLLIYKEVSMKNYNIITLGASGSGKTVFLASMFKELGIQESHGFYLKVEEQHKQRLLNAIYAQVISGDKWPTGTSYSEVSEWVFTCCVKTTDLNDYAACQFTYFDYAGGRLTDIEEDLEFKDLVAKADTILGLLDGQKIYSLLQGKTDKAVNDLLKTDLPSILKWMFGCRVPIHFVVTKWDLVEKEFSLQQVAEELFKIPEFKELVRTRTQAGAPVRLIPVSSVGSGFAISQPDGSMKKISGAVPHPSQVEVPIACVLPDGLRARLSELAEKREQLTKSADAKKPLFNRLTGFFEAAKPFAEFASYFLPLEFQLPVWIISEVGSGINSIRQQSLEEKAKKLQSEKEQSMKLVNDEETALEHSIKSFLLVQTEFQRDFPASDLIVI
ncbi:MAG TPA: hypothetical protein V6C65_18205 [Allocoleopsis sp.]